MRHIKTAWESQLDAHLIEVGCRSPREKVGDVLGARKRSQHSIKRPNLSLAVAIFFPAGAIVLFLSVKKVVDKLGVQAERALGKGLYFAGDVCTIEERPEGVPGIPSDPTASKHKALCTCPAWYWITMPGAGALELQIHFVVVFYVLSCKLRARHLCLTSYRSAATSWSRSAYPRPPLNGRSIL